MSMGPEFAIPFIWVPAGRTQRVLPLSGGALLLLSNTRYSTPSHAPIDKVQPWAETESSLHSK